MKDYEEFPICKQDGFISKKVNDNSIVKIRILNFFISMFRNERVLKVSFRSADPKFNYAHCHRILASLQ